MTRLKPVRPWAVPIAKLLAGGEDTSVEWKESGVKSEALVAFANSGTGGTILIGVRDDGSLNGKLLTDELKTTIGSRAASCYPPLQVHLSQEYHQGVPVVRIDIPPSEHRPHCTGAGAYVIRGDAQTKHLTPPELLDMFVDREGNRFEARFQAATDRAIAELREATSSLTHEVKILRDLSESVHDAATRASDAAARAEEAAVEAANNECP